MTITYAALLGSVALGSALPSGLAGAKWRRKCEHGYDKGRDQKDQVKATADGKERGQQQADRAKEKARPKSRTAATPQTEREPARATRRRQPQTTNQR